MLRDFYILKEIYVLDVIIIIGYFFKINLIKLPFQLFL